MHIALAELHLEHLFVVYPGSKAYPLGEKITVVPLSRIESCRSLISSRRTGGPPTLPVPPAGSE